MPHAPTLHHEHQQFQNHVWRRWQRRTVRTRIGCVGFVFGAASSAVFATRPEGKYGHGCSYVTATNVSQRYFLHLLIFWLYLLTHTHTHGA